MAFVKENSNNNNLNLLSFCKVKEDNILVCEDTARSRDDTQYVRHEELINVLSPFLSFDLDDG